MYVEIWWMWMPKDLVQWRIDKWNIEQRDSEKLEFPVPPSSFEFEYKRSSMKNARINDFHQGSEIAQWIAFYCNILVELVSASWNFV